MDERKKVEAAVEMSWMGVLGRKKVSRVKFDTEIR